MDGKTWQKANAFSGLAKDTSYTFYQRLTSDGNHNASPSSSAKIRTAKTFRVTYQVTGSIPKGAPAAPKDKKVYEANAEVTVVKAPAMKGYTFSGWKTQDAKISKGKFKMPGKDVTLTGSWKVNQHVLTVNYVYTDGSKAKEPYRKTLAYGASYSVTSPKTTGYTAGRTAVKGKEGLWYESDNPKAAKVGKRNGKVMAVAEGTCNVFVYAQNGIGQKVKIIVN